MGVYAQTDFTIETDSEATTKKVAQAIKELGKGKEGIAVGNFFVNNEDSTGTYYEGSMSSNRYQNLEWQIEEIWKAVKGIRGVKRIEAPFMVESEEGFYAEVEETI